VLTDNKGQTPTTSSTVKKHARALGYKSRPGDAATKNANG
jgi:hypothetical protein